MKSIFEIDADNPSTLQSVMLIGEQAVKLIQAISDSNEQVIKAAALKQKEKPKGDDNESSKPFDIESIRKAIEK